MNIMMTIVKQREGIKMSIRGLQKLLMTRFTFDECAHALHIIIRNIHRTIDFSNCTLSLKYNSDCDTYVWNKLKFCIALFITIGNVIIQESVTIYS